MGQRYEEDGSVGVVEPKAATHEKLARPRRYRVLLHNDDYTTREFVVDVLTGVFRRSESDAVAIMLHVHHNGVGVAGVYTREVAETKVGTVEALAKEHEFPLRVSMEPDADDEGEP